MRSRGLFVCQKGRGGADNGKCPSVGWVVVGSGGGWVD